MKKVLIIDDDKNLCENLKIVLSKYDYQAYSAENGKEGLLMTEQTKPDIILCDIMMNDIDGYKILKFVRNKTELSLVPFIFLTAKAEREDLRKGMELGADDYITKPFKVDELLKAIKVRLDKSKLLSQTLLKKSNNVFVFVKCNNQIEKLDLNSIECIIADNIYSKVYLNSKNFIPVRKSLKKWEEILPGDKFIRVHRKAIINIQYIQKIEKWFNQKMKITMIDCDEEIYASRNYTHKLKGKLFI